MFSVLQSPYTFDAVPSMFMDPMFLTPEPKRRRVHNGPMRVTSPKNLTRPYTPVSLRYEVKGTDRGYILSIHKRLPRDQLRHEINHELTALKDQMYRPTYHYCGFFGGLVEEEADDELLTRQAISKLNVQSVCRRVARQAFKDYKIELNHRGDELSIVSRADGVAKEFDLGVNIDDLEIIRCQLDESCSNAVWRILLVKEGASEPSDIVKGPHVENFRSHEQEQEDFQELEPEQEPEQCLQSEPTVQEPEQEQEKEQEKEQEREQHAPLKITINFAQDQKPEQQNHASPILEEVEDEEVDRFRKLVSRAPAGSAILEDY